MKIHILCLSILLAVAGVKCTLKEEFEKIDKACRDVSHVSEADIKAFFKGETKSSPKEALKCHIKCVMEKHGHWKNGAFDVATAMKHLEDIPQLKAKQTEISKVMEECKDQKGSNECDTAYLVSKCIIEHHAVSVK